MGASESVLAPALAEAAYAEACRSDDAERARELLAARRPGCGDRKSLSGPSAFEGLVAACSRGNVETVQALLAASRHHVVDEGEDHVLVPALHVTAKTRGDSAGKSPRAEEPAESEVDPRRLSSDGSGSSGGGGSDGGGGGGEAATAAAAAAARGRNKLLQALHSSLSSVNQVSWLDPRNAHSLALRKACRMGHIEIVRILLDDGRVDITASNQYCIRVACQKGNLELVCLLLEHPDVDPTVLNDDAFRTAAAYGHLAICQALLAWQRPSTSHSALLFDTVDPASQNNYAIRLAAYNGHWSICKLLLGCETCDPAVEDSLPLRLAIKGGHPQIHQNAIYLASARGNLEIINLILLHPLVDASHLDNRALRSARSDAVFATILRSKRVQISLRPDAVLVDPRIAAAYELLLSNTVQACRRCLGIISATRRDSHPWSVLSKDSLLRVLAMAFGHDVTSSVWKNSESSDDDSGNEMENENENVKNRHRESGGESDEDDEDEEDRRQTERRQNRNNRANDLDEEVLNAAIDAGAAVKRMFGTQDEDAPAPRSRRPAAAVQDDSDDEEDGDPDAMAARAAAEEEDDEGEDLEDTAERDYRAIAELDNYDMTMLDGNEYRNMSAAQRKRAEQELAERDREEQGRQVRLPGMLQDDSDSEEDEDDAERRRARARREAYEYAAADGEENSEDADEEPADTAPVDLQNFIVPLTEFVENEAVQNEVKRRFEDFLRTFVESDNSRPVYEERISDMCMRNTQSLLVSYMHLSKSKPTLAIWLADHPAGVLPLLNDVANKVVFEQFPNYGEIQEEVYVRIVDLPLADALRDLRTIHLNALVRVSGIVTRRSQVKPMLSKVFYSCPTCHSRVGPIHLQPGDAPPRMTCEECEPGENEKPTLLELDDEASVYHNYQHILLQESPGTVPPGRVPRYKTVNLYADLVDSARPGEEIEVTGIYKHEVSNRYLNAQQGFPVFATVLEANHIRKTEDLASSVLITDEDRARFQRLSRDPQIIDRVITSIAPSIYGHKEVKTALALAMFGGRELNVKNKHRIRGDINVLLMGDPGTAKSQCLKYVEKTAPRAVYTTGKGASAVGLTAAVQKDPISKEWVLEGGALVLADRGVCLIDEFDKMNDQDRTSIHEAMEQQSISISKAGIVTTLQARCSVVAAANPIGGRYDPQKSFSEQVALTDPIIQRFDILCVLQDRIDPLADERLAKFVVGSHVKSHPEGCLSPEEARQLQQRRLDAEDPYAGGAGGASDQAALETEDDPLAGRNVNTFSSWCEGAANGEVIDQELLRKYILYARSLKPQLERIDVNKIENLYAELRAESMNSGGIPIAVRHMESILRIAESFARMQLREYVRDDDLDRAIQVMLDSFIGAQKFSVMRQLRRSFQRYITCNKDHNELLIYLLEEMFRTQQHFMTPDQVSAQVQVSEFERRARELGVHDLTHFYKSDEFAQREFNLRFVENPARPDKQTRVIIKDLIQSTV
ncbi:DNA replication licensing factor MCM2 [Hondaea fermentalgiana]|uniref:DNA replication licensing factor MCM2 n=1 Tax=Hondaea fermentalgiana TaxID=2315210 RepID=A0A2R5G3C3_9STRA|nr:DNA replication licensing factor MCM2 [Hondaea fermentalgiana]|eukprot:GBG25536.1 DNA replication licensing factor MCM2 [Hondaea fermentalgiana]